MGQARLTASTDPLGRRSTTAYDRAGRAVAQANPLNQRTTTLYDAAGQAVATVSPLGARVSFAYDLAGRRTRLADANGHPTTSLYDSAGQLTARLDPLLRRTSFAYDRAGRTLLTLDARGLRITSAYDAAGRRTAELLPAGQRSTYAYDPAGRRVLLSDSFGRTTTVYDAKGRVLLVNQPGGKRVSYAYDLADRRRYVADPDGGRTTYSHDAAGRLLAVNAPGAGRSSLAYDPAGRTLARWSGSAGRTSYAYDSAGQLSAVAGSHAGLSPGRPLDFALYAPLASYAPVNRFTYLYDQAGRRTLVLALLGVRTSYAYDASGQLVRERRAAGPLPADATFSYDPAGNRTLLIDSGRRTTSSYDAANQQLVDLTAAGRTTYSYDAAGNRTLLETPSAATYYAWDAHNRLTQAEPVGGPVTYAYDGDGRRTRRQAPAQTRRFVYDFEKVLQDTDDGGLTQKQYASSEEQYGELLSAYGGGQARYFAPDGLGSTDALLAPDGSVPDRWSYRAFGLESHALGSDDNRFTWVGSQGYYDDREAGLYFLRARYYDPAAARFASPDPSGFAAGDANLYRYAGNDPVNHTDPSGLQGEPLPCSQPSPATCDVKAQIKDVLKAAEKVGGEAKTFQKAWANASSSPDYRSPLESLLHAFDPREAGKSVLDCACFLKRNASPRLLNQVRDCGAAVLAAGANFGLSLIGVAPPPEPMGLPASCWEVFLRVYLRGNRPPPSGSPASKWVDWVLEVLKHPCLLAFPPAKALVEVAVSYRDSFVKVLEKAEELWAKRDEYKERITKFVSDRIDFLQNCFQNMWGWVKEKADALATRLIKALGLGPVGERITRAALCLALDSLKDSVLAALSGPVEWFKAVAEGLAEAVNPWGRVGEALGRVWDSALQAARKLGGGAFGEAAEALKAVLEHTLSAVEGLGGYIWLVLIAVPSAIGSLLPGPGTAAGAALGQKVNSVIGVVQGLVGGALKGLSAFEGVQGMWELIQKKVVEAKKLAADVGATVEDLIDTAEGEIPLAVFTEKEEQELTALLAKALAAAIGAGVGLVLSVVGTAVAGVAGKFVKYFKGTLEEVAGKNVEKRTATCAKKKRRGKCFAAGTLVHAEHGLVPIEAVECGERVWGRDGRTGAWRLAAVVDTFARPYAGEVVTVRVGAGEAVVCTAGHPFWVDGGGDLASRPAVDEWLGEEYGGGLVPVSQHQGRWVQARDLRAGDVLTSKSGGHFVVAAVESGRWAATVYNLHVEGVHSYAVGRAGVLVHNTSLPSGCRYNQCDTKAARKLVKRCRDVQKNAKLAKACPKAQAKLLGQCADAVKQARAHPKEDVTKAQDKLCPEKPTCCAAGMTPCKPDPCAMKWPSGRRGLSYRDFDTITITYKDTIADPANPGKRITVGIQKSVQFKKVRLFIARLKYYGPDPTKEPNNTTRDWFRGDSSIGYDTDDPGHILANIFGGYANVARGNGNLFPQNMYVNQNTLNYFERDTIKPEVTKPNSDVCIQIEFYFGSPGKPGRPIRFNYSYWFSGMFIETKPFPNPQ